MANGRTVKIVRLPGDGIGPEVVHAAWQVLEKVASRFGVMVEGTEHRIGGEALDADGSPLPTRTLDACRVSDAILLGAVGGPRWDKAPVRPERGLLDLRKALGLYLNLRPVKPIREIVATASPLKLEYLDDVDMVILRELTGGLYFSQPKERRLIEGERSAVDTLEYRESEIRRVAERAFQLARTRRKRVTSVDKANVLESSRLWREVVEEVHSNYTDVALEHQLVDSMAMRLITHARSFDVVLTSNMFGDILTDEAAVLGGSLGVLPSASIGDDRGALYEPIHGSAPDLVGSGKANPMATILSVALLFRHSIGLENAARQIESGVVQTIRSGVMTPDLGGTSTTREVTDAVLEHVTEEVIS
ncbi:MAG: 3-isopropylmalate dehydrogenase [Myxococcota bacterium]